MADAADAAPVLQQGSDDRTYDGVNSFEELAQRLASKVDGLTKEKILEFLNNTKLHGAGNIEQFRKIARLPKAIDMVLNLCEYERFPPTALVEFQQFFEECKPPPPQQPPQQDASDHKLYKVTAALCSNSGRADGLRKKAFTWLTSLKAKCRQDDETHGVSYTMIPRGTDGGDVQDEATSDPGGDDAQDAAASDQGGVSAVEYPPETMMLMFEVYFQDASKAQKAVDILNFEETSPFTFFLIDREKSSAKGESVTKHCDLIDIVGFEHYKKHEDSSSDTCSATTSESSRWNGKDSLKHHVFTYQTVSPKCPRGGINKAHLIDATYTNREKRLNVQGKKRLPRMDDDLADLPKIEVLKEAMEQCKIPREGDGPLTWKDLNFLDKSTDNFIGIESTLHPYVDNMACFDFELTKVLDEHKLSAKKESTYLCPQVEVAVTLYSTEDEVVAHLATSMKGFSHGMRGRSYLVHMYAHNPAIFAACMEIKSALNAKARSVDSGAT